MHPKGNWLYKVNLCVCVLQNNHLKDNLPRLSNSLASSVSLSKEICYRVDPVITGVPRFLGNFIKCLSLSSTTYAISFFEFPCCFSGGNARKLTSLIRFTPSRSSPSSPELNVWNIFQLFWNSFK